MKSSQSNLIFGALAIAAAVAFGVWKFKPVETPPPAALIHSDPDTGEMRDDRQEYVPPDDPALMNQVFDFDNLENKFLQHIL